MDYSKLVGIPYISNGRTLKGADCWGIAYLYHDGKIPSYAETYNNAINPSQISATITANKTQWEVVKYPQQGDIVVFNIMGLPVHCGVVIDDGLMLHTLAGHDSCIEKFNTPKWLTRIEGFYRWMS